MVTRRGKQARSVGQADEWRGPANSRPRLRAWEAERATFERLLATRLRRYRGRWVAVLGGRIVGSARNADKLIARMAKRFGSNVFFVGYVGRQPPPAGMPGFEVACGDR